MNGLVLLIHNSVLYVVLPNTNADILCCFELDKIFLLIVTVS